MIRNILLMGLSLVLLMSCCETKKKHEDWSEARLEMETRGQTLLAQSRTALADYDFEAARNAIRQLRRTCNLAFECRAEGILLMDSIDLQETLQSMVALDSIIQETPNAADSLSRHLEVLNQKIKFYRRKLEHDKHSMQASKK